MTNTIKIPKTARAFNRSGASQAARLDISKAVDRADMGVFFTNLNFRSDMGTYFFFSKE